MPRITVDHSDRPADDVDRPGFAQALHAAAFEIAAAKPSACKTRFRRTEETTVGTDTGGHAVVLALAPGRTGATKDRLTTAVVESLRRYGKPADGLVLRLPAEVRDLDMSYRRFES